MMICAIDTTITRCHNAASHELPYWLALLLAHIIITIIIIYADAILILPSLAAAFSDIELMIMRHRIASAIIMPLAPRHDDIAISRHFSPVFADIA
jgi:hypothetical protein